MAFANCREQVYIFSWLTDYTDTKEMTMKLKEKLKEEGYSRFRGAVDASVYEYFNCDRSWKAEWYLKEDHFRCCGCKERCETSDPEGFQLFLDLG
ncbi:DNA-binding protein [Pseudodesulfovibrio sp. S3]|uniref:DNA-binding protein n=2 Tax=unclassified Pseudodesulfovibrio TaxID=2661612 RepID=UPI001F4FB39B|nr:DNA-binding protein [Pseudodesulfovibrio sp. S3]MCJ2165809.1 DNA-binding protein [Pseudodesulfovibrio sp. S3-i]